MEHEIEVSLDEGLRRDGLVALEVHLPEDGEKGRGDQDHGERGRGAFAEFAASDAAGDDARDRVRATIRGRLPER